MRRRKLKRVVKHPKTQAHIYRLLKDAKLATMIASHRYMFEWDGARKLYRDTRYDVDIYWGDRNRWYITIPYMTCPSFGTPEKAVEFLVNNYCPFAIGTHGVN